VRSSLTGGGPSISAGSPSRILVRISQEDRRTENSRRDKGKVVEAGVWKHSEFPLIREIGETSEKGAYRGFRTPQGVGAGA
jgi:hypothetical protein